MAKNQSTGYSRIFWILLIPFLAISSCFNNDKESTSTYKPTTNFYDVT